jgi:hypothetical protein
MSASGALRTNDIWSKTIGHDPYGAGKEVDVKNEADISGQQAASLMLLAKMSNLSGVESRGGCKKCGMLGHLSFQCRNIATTVQAIQHSSSESDSDDDISVTEINEVNAKLNSEGPTLSSKRKFEINSKDNEIIKKQHDDDVHIANEKKSKKKSKKSSKSKHSKKHRKSKKTE